MCSEPLAVGGGVLAATLLPSAPYAQAPANRFPGDPVKLNFVNADIEAVSRAMGAILKQQFVVEPRVKGTITLFSEQPISPREAYLNYLAALRGLGFTVVEVGGLFKVVPEADAKLQTGTVAIGETNRSADQVLGASGQVSSAAERLAAEVQEFFIKLRNGPMDRRKESDPSYRGPERRTERRGRKVA